MILKKLCTHGLCFYTLIFVTTLKIGAQVPFYGKVLSENKEPMENVNVIIRHIPDSTLLTIAITDSLGAYKVNNLSFPCLLDLSFVGFKTQTLVCNNTSDIPKVIIMKEEVESLNEVVALAKSIHSKNIIGGIECRIFNETITGNRSIVDLLSYLPLVTTAGYENFRVAEKKCVVFFINGRRTYYSPPALFSYLRTLSADKLSSVKVLYQPPLDYGVDNDCAVIDLNINDDNVGLQGSLRAEVIKTKHWKQTGSSTIVYQTPKWQTQIYFGARNLSDYAQRIENTTYFHNQQSIEQKQEQNTKRKQYDFNITTEYELTPKQKIGASVDLYSYNGNPYTELETKFLTKSFSDSTLIGLIDSRYNDQYLASTLYYQGRFANEAWISATLVGLWSNYKNKASYTYSRGDLEYTPVFMDYNVSLPMKTNSYEAKIKARIPIIAKLKLYAGSQLVYRKVLYNELYNIIKLPTTLTFDNQSLKYNEINFTPYALIGYEFPHSITFYGGVYAQYYNTNGAYNQTPVSSYCNQWFLLPYLNLLWSKEELSLAYSLSTSNYYSNFVYYSPFKRWYSTTSYTQGDPKLKPVNYINQSLAIRYKKMYGKVYYSIGRDETLQIPTLENDNIIAKRTYNYGNTHALGFSLSYGVDITPWWYFSGNTTISYSMLNKKTKLLNVAKNPYSNTLFASANISNALTLSEKHNWTADLNLSYSTPSQWGYSTRVGIMQLNVSMRKSIGENFIVSLWGYSAWRHSINNQFHKWGISITQTPSFKSWSKSWGEDMGVSISLTYYFGKSSLKQRIERRSADASRIVITQ